LEGSTLWSSSFSSMESSGGRGQATRCRWVGSDETR
jgi:hypothetical protein